MREEWPKIALGDVTTQVKEAVKVVPGVSYNLLGLRMYGGGVYHRETVTSQTSKASTFYRARAGQFIYNRLFAWGGTFGIVTEELDDSFVSNEFPIFDCDPAQTSAAYLGLYFKQPFVWREIDAMSTGTTATRNRWKEREFGAYKIPLPPLPVQSRIIQVMSALDAQLDALVAESKAMEGVLGALRSELPEAPEMPLSAVLESIDNGKSVQAGEEATDDDDFRILKLSAVQRGWFNPREAKSLVDNSNLTSNHVIRNGDLLVTRANTPARVGFAAVANGVAEGTYMPDLIWRLQVDSAQVTTDYLAHVLSSPQLRRQITAAAGGTSKSMVKINKRGFRMITLPVPGLDVQIAYTARCDAVVEHAASLRTEADRLVAAKARLLSALLKREIEVPGVDEMDIEGMVA